MQTLSAKDKLTVAALEKFMEENKQDVPAQFADLFFIIKKLRTTLEKAIIQRNAYAMDYFEALSPTVTYDDNENNQALLRVLNAEN